MDIAPVATRLTSARLWTNTLSEIMNAISREKGFWEDWELADALESLADDDRINSEVDIELVDVILRQAASALRNNVIGTKLMLIVSELAEAIASLRSTGYEGHHAGQGNIGEELADAQIRIGDLARMMGVEIGDQVVEKIVTNSGRTHKHGKKL